MIKKRKVMRMIEEIDDVICNKCGGSCQGWCEDFFGLIEARVEGGYGSEILSDGEVYQFSLCEYCLQELFNSFKIPIQNEGYYDSYELVIPNDD